MTLDDVYELGFDILNDFQLPICVSNNKYLIIYIYIYYPITAKKNAKNEEFSNVCGQIEFRYNDIDWIFGFIF